MRARTTAPARRATAVPHVEEDGPADGYPLVLLHGFSGSGRWFDAFVPHLADTYRVIRVDLLGHGRTGGPAADAPEQARMVEGVLADLGLDRVTVLGHSFGADVAVELDESSTRVEALVVVCQAPDYSDARLPRGNAIMTVPVLGTALHRAAPVIMRAYAWAHRGEAGYELVHQAIADNRALNPGTYRVVLRDRPRRMARRPLDAQVRAAGKPALVVLGGRDHFYGARSAARYEAAGATVEILPRSGHSPTTEAPDELAAVVRTFVGRVACS